MSYYAVRKGRTNRVIVTNWKECSDLVTGYSGAEYKKFDSEEKAREFIDLKRKFDQITNQNECLELDAKRLKSEDGESWTVVYTDGYCKDNDIKTKVRNRKSGIGVYFPDGQIKIGKEIEIMDDSENTNNKAELLAVKEALLTALSTQNLEIRTDSMYVINVFTIWLADWKANPNKLKKKEKFENYQSDSKFDRSKKRKSKVDSL
jgi:ribonuclease HI